MNRARGEAEAVLAGERRTLCLTLGALAEIEAGLGAEGFEALAGRLRTLSAGNLAVVLGALLKGAGAGASEAEEVARTCSPREAAEAVAEAFRAAG